MSKINYGSLRARKARFGRKIGLWVWLLAIIGLILLAMGVSLVVVGYPIGWLLIAFAVPPGMLVTWYRSDLKNIPTLPGGKTIDSFLETDMLAVLPDKASPSQIAVAALSANSARFIAVRFGIPFDLLKEGSSTNPDDSAQVWDRAQAICRSNQAKILRASMVVVALAVTQPAIKTILPSLQVDGDDLEAGARWYERIIELIDNNGEPRRTGGIARDWNFGYANLLERFSSNISEQVGSGGLLHVRLDSHQAILRQLHDIFGNNGRQNVALVGRLGAGKTTVVRAFAESLLAANSRQVAKPLRFRQILGLDAGAILSAARNRSELENLVSMLLVEGFKAKNIILFLDEAQLFFEDGNGSVDIASLLLPILEGGRLKIILAMDEQAYLRIAARNPALAASLNRVNVPPATESETILVAQDQIIPMESGQSVTYTYQALKEAYRLSERYLHDIAQPGRTVRLLEQSANFADQKFVTNTSVAQAIEQMNGVKVASVNNDSQDKKRLLNMEQLIHERMVNQSRAVGVVSDALRRARAGVRNEKRPIGTFLFLGPTGVGKTELAKALAAVYFGGEDRIVRVDLNEFVRPDDVVRLIADGADDPHSLTAGVMKQPFSVVLLDEIEKAHSQVLTTLLQMLDEGILRDVRGREVSFRDAIVIATSNAGADRVRQLIGAGYSLEQFEKQFVDELIDSQQFRPEFLNRFDEIVVFRPLDQGELVQVVERMIQGVNKTLAPQKVQVSVTQEAATKLASIGYDPRLGARPMRRVIQRTVENLVAKRLLEGSAQPGDTIKVGAADIEVDS